MIKIGYRSHNFLILAISIPNFNLDHGDIFSLYFIVVKTHNMTYGYRKPILLFTQLAEESARPNLSTFPLSTFPLVSHLGYTIYTYTLRVHPLLGAEN